MAALSDLPDGHDLDHLRAALAMFPGRGCAVDGGAHRGIWTRELCRHFDQVIAFEPREAMADRIGCGRVIVKALGETAGRCAMADGTENTGQAHVVAGEEIDVVPLDQYDLAPDFLKLDVEGYELHALKGAANTVERCRPAIMLELNGLSTRYGVEHADIEGFLRGFGYRHAGQWNKDHLYLCA